jgi:signal peptidase I
MAKFKPKKKKNESKPFPMQGRISSFMKNFSFLRWLDPFTYVDLFVMPAVKKYTQSTFVEFLVNVLFALLFAWVIYSALGLIFGTANPLVIVYSASMENTFFRGDVMALNKVNDSDFFGPVVSLNIPIKDVPVLDYATPVYSDAGSLKSIVFNGTGKEIVPNTSGSIVVYNAFPSSLPIIHRAIVKLQATDGNFILTKGDNSVTNSTFDQDCGKINPTFFISEKNCITFYAIPVKELDGKTFFMVPKVGCIKLWLVDDLFSLFSTGSLPRDFRGIC